jgi:hypothetical protein
MRGLVGEPNEMKIELRPHTKIIKKRPYHMNPHYKEQVKEETNKMLTVGLILQDKNYEWI